MTVDSQLAEKGLDAKVLEKNKLQGIAEKYRLQGFDGVRPQYNTIIRQQQETRTD